MKSAPGSRSSFALLALVLTSCSSPTPGTPGGLAANPAALRLSLHTPFAVVPLGTDVDVTIALRDAQGGRASAPRALAIELSVEGGPRTKVDLQPGETERDVAVTPTREGILEIRASGGELVPGSCFVKVTRPEPSRARARHVPSGSRP